MNRSSVRVVMVAALTGVVVAAGLGAWLAFSASESQARPNPMTSPRSGVVQRHTFVSLVPACGCAAQTELQAFSTITGRMTRDLGPVQLPRDATVGAPAIQAGRGLLFTVSTGWRCDSTGASIECPHIEPNSCTNHVLSITPGEGGAQVEFSVPGRYLINDAVPSPDGKQIALARTACTQRNGLTGLFLRSMATGRGDLLFGRRNACDGIERPAWSPSGNRIAFVYSRAKSAPTPGFVGGIRTCPTARTDIVIAGTGSHPRVQRIPADPGCAWGAVAFDAEGVLAAEGCKHGSPAGLSDTSLGDAYLLQLSNTGHQLRRWPLKRGLEEALITPEPGTNRLLITQDLPANNGEPEDDWVWELNATQLRLINHYHANDAAQILAVGW